MALTAGRLPLSFLMSPLNVNQDDPSQASHVTYARVLGTASAGPDQTIYALKPPCHCNSADDVPCAETLQMGGRAALLTHCSTLLILTTSFVLMKATQPYSLRGKGK